MASLRDEYLDKHNGDWVAAAAGFAKDLNRDDPETFKVGYSRVNAILSSGEIFPEVTEDEIRDLNGWGQQ